MLWWFGGGGGVKVLISIVKESRETDRDSQPEGEKKKGAYERDATWREKIEFIGSYVIIKLFFVFAK